MNMFAKFIPVGVKVIRIREYQSPHYKKIPWTLLRLRKEQSNAVVIKNRAIDSMYKSARKSVEDMGRRLDDASQLHI